MIAYFGCHDPLHAASDFKGLATRFQTVVLPITEQDVTYSPGTVRDLVSAAHDAGLEAWVGAWGIGGVFGGEGLSAVGHLPALSEEVDAVMLRWLDVVKASGANAAFLDEPRASDGGVGFLLHELLTEAADRSLRCSLCLSPEHEWVRPEYVADRVFSVGTDPYDVFCSPVELVPYLDKWNLRLTKYADAIGAKTHAWVRGFRVPVEHHDKIALSLRLWAKMGVPRIGLWSFRPERVSVLSNPQPGSLWRVICGTIDDLQGGDSKI